MPYVKQATKFGRIWCDVGGYLMDLTLHQTPDEAECKTMDKFVRH